MGTLLSKSQNMSRMLRWQQREQWLIAWSTATHKEVAEHVRLLLVFGPCGSIGLASEALERRPLSTADDATTVAGATVALCCFPAIQPYTKKYHRHCCHLFFFGSNNWLSVISDLSPWPQHWFNPCGCTGTHYGNTILRCRGPLRLPLPSQVPIFVELSWLFLSSLSFPDLNPGSSTTVLATACRLWDIYSISTLLMLPVGCRYTDISSSSSLECRVTLSLRCCKGTSHSQVLCRRYCYYDGNTDS